MNIEDMKTLYKYNYWATRRILKISEQLSAEQFLAQTPHSYGTLRGTMVHILDAECGWRMLWQHHTTEYFDKMDEKAFPTVRPLAQRWDNEEKAMWEYLHSLTDESLNDSVRYTVDTGEKRERLLWHCLFHLVNHGTHHRSQAAAIVKSHGPSVGDLDFTVFLNETRSC